MLVLIVTAPFALYFILKKRKLTYHLLVYSVVGLCLLVGLVWLFAWWVDKADWLLLEHYGYNSDGMNEREIYGNVLPENLEAVKSLETSVSGIGWPLKAIFGSVMILPLLIVGYIVGMVVEGLRKYVLEKKYVN